MKTKFLLVAATALGAAAAWPQLRITSFKPSGEITFTNFAQIGAYRVAWANSPAGPWNSFDALTNLNLIWATTNRVTVQVPMTNASAVFRPAWIEPEPLGNWDYQGYDHRGVLVITGLLSFVSKTLDSSNPSNPTYTVQGSYNLQYAGPPSNQNSYFPPEIGTGSLSGGLDVGYADLHFYWPTGVDDDNIYLFGTLLPNAYTGQWVHATFGGARVGSFTSTRR